MDFLETHWSDPDNGIWEVRGPRRHFVHSKVMAWVAIDRAIEGVEKCGLPGPAARWKQLRQRIHEEVCERGFNPAKGAFTQYYGCDELDASVLMIPLVGFLPPTDERVVSTVEAIERELVVDGFVKRYRTEDTDTGGVDGLRGSEGTFLPCTFWLIDNLALIGRVDDAQAMFERLLGLCNDLGLYAEEYDPRARRMVGNYPQAFTHVGLVNSARNLARALKRSR
jgi:GH15 family glucan-1,4-alpha-glucosidase